MYQLSARQILTIALLSAVFAAGTVFVISRFSGQVQPSGAAAPEVYPAGISDPATVSDEQNNIEVYKTLSPGVAFITSTMYQRDIFGEVEEGQGSGSGSVIDDQGHIITNYHVVEGAQKLSVSLGGDKVYPATLVGGDPDTDLAVIKINVPREQLTVIPFGNSDNLIVGQKVLAIGNPFGLDRTLTTGVISGLQRPIRARNQRLIEGAIQTDASINPGNSGGPLLNTRGQMIGINSQILSPAGGSVGVGFAVPVSIARRIIPQLIQYGKVRRPKLGISLVDVAKLTGRLRMPTENGVLINTISQGGPAEAAGLKGTSQTYDGLILGDIITAIDGEPVENQDDLARILDKRQIGSTVRVEVFRGGGKITVPVRLTEVPESRRPTRRAGEE
ncbi:MAG: trypsin-like peptidase domain-containing protein [Pyrinomonadaceae bacterium]